MKLSSFVQMCCVHRGGKCVPQTFPYKAVLLLLLLLPHHVYTCIFNIILPSVRAYVDWPTNQSTSSYKPQCSAENVCGNPTFAVIFFRMMMRPTGVYKIRQRGQLSLYNIDSLKLFYSTRPKKIWQQNFSQFSNKKSLSCKELIFSALLD